MSVDGPRVMRLDERQDLIDHVNRVMRQEVGSDPTYGEDWPHVHQPENVPNIFVVREDDQIVASTAIYPHDTRLGDVELRIGGINGVSTDVPYRRRGYATQVLDACIERMAELGCHVSLLSTGVPSWYRKQGWEYGGTVRVYRFDRGNRSFLPSEPVPEIRPATDGDFEALSEISDARAWGAVRPPGHMRAMLRRRNSTVWVAERNGRAGAYVFARGAAMAEYGGPADLVVPMIARLLADWDDPAVKTSTQSVAERRAGRNPTVHATLAAPARADDVTDVLDAVGIMKSADYIGMIRIEDPVGLVRAYGRDDLEPVDDGEAIVMTVGGARTRLSRNDAGKLLFGPERPPGANDPRLPLAFHEWSADRV